MSKMTKKLFVISLTITTIAWMVGGIFVAKPALAVTTGSLIKTATSSAVYYVGEVSGVQKKYVFPDDKVYFSWYSNFSTVQTVSQETLQGIDTIGNVVARAGTKLVQFVAIGGNGQLVVDDPKVYAVSPNGVKHWITTAEIAVTLYGTNWETKIYGVPNFLVSNYTAGADITTATYPEGALVKLADNSQVYYINATGQKQPVTSAGFTGNMFQDMYVQVAASLTAYPDGTSLTAADPVLTNVAQSGAAAQVGSGLTVAKASDTPASSAIVSYGASAATGGQGFIPTLKLNFTAAADGAVKVTNLKLKRLGINATTDMDAVYLYDIDGTFLASHQSIASDYITFNNSAGLFTVNAGTTKPIMVKFNLNKNSTSGKTIGYQVAAATDITTDGATVNGTFPMDGNLMTVANVTDFGRLQADTISQPSTINPSTTQQDLWTFSLQGSNQIITLETIVLTNVGSASNTDIQDLKLYVDGAQIGTTAANLGTANKVTFAGLNYTIDNGQTKNFTVKGKVIGGSSKTFRLSQQNVYDIMAKDQNYNAYIVADDGTVGQWTVNQQTATTINTGSLSINLATTSPVGYMPANLSADTTIAIYDLTAVGEDVKVNYLYGTIVTAITQLGMDQVKFFFGGSQVGITQDATSTATSWTNLGSSLIVPGDGVAHQLTIKGRTKEGDGTAYTSGTTFYFTLNGTAGDAQGVTSLTSIALSTAINSNTITISSSAPTIAKNTNVNDFTSDNPTGVKNAQDVLVASYSIIGGTAEPIDVTSLVIADVYAATDELGDMFYNLEVWNGNTNTKIGDTIANLTTASTEDQYTFTPATAIRVGVNESLVINLKADVKATTTALTVPTTLSKLDQVSYNKVNTGGSTTWSTEATGQADVILSSGTLTVTAADTQVPANIITMSPSGSYNTVELAKFKFVAQFEAMRLEKITFNELVGKAQVVSTTNATSSLINYTLWNGATQLGGYGIDSVTSTPNEGKYIVFNLTDNPAIPGDERVLPVGTNNLTLKAMTNTISQAAAGSTHRITLDAPDVQTVYGSSSNTAITGQPTSAINANTLILTRQMPIVTSETWTDHTLTSGNTETLYKWTVTPSGDTSGGSLRLKKMTFATTMTDSTTSTKLTFDQFSLTRSDGQSLTAGTDYYIYDGTGTAAGDRLDTGGTATMWSGYIDYVNTTDVDFSATGTAVIVFNTEDVVPTTGVTYELKARVQNVGVVSTDVDSIAVQLLGADDAAVHGSTPPTSGAHYLDGTPDAEGDKAGFWALNLNTANTSLAATEKVGYFIWSDYSKGVSHSSNNMTTPTYTSSQDWFDGYKVRTSATQSTYLPLATQTLNK